MTLRRLSRPALGIGLVMLAVSFVWPWIVPPSSLWNDADANELTAASESLHATMHEHEHEHDHDAFAETHADDPPEVVAAADRYRNAQAGLARATFWSARAPQLVRYAGIALCVAGVFAHFMASRE